VLFSCFMIGGLLELNSTWRGLNDKRLGFMFTVLATGVLDIKRKMDS
jgi:hypothetical protein